MAGPAQRAAQPVGHGQPSRVSRLAAVAALFVAGANAGASKKTSLLASGRDCNICIGRSLECTRADTVSQGQTPAPDVPEQLCHTCADFSQSLFTVNNDIAGISRRMQPRCQQCRDGSPAQPEHVRAR
eukprot:COSAG04_NODE_19383_length_417_cov_1.333333_1_plen_127_part_10